MSGKSIFLSILSFIIFIGVVVGVVFLFQVQFIFGLLGILLVIIPIKINRTAVEAANGPIDKFIAKFLVPILVFIALIFVVLFFTLWM